MDVRISSEYIKSSGRVDTGGRVMMLASIIDFNFVRQTTVLPIFTNFSRDTDKASPDGNVWLPMNGLNALDILSFGTAAVGDIFAWAISCLKSVKQIEKTRDDFIY